jgi:hypothetical protein
MSGMFAQELFEGAASQQLKRLLKLVHAEQKQSKTGRQAPDVNVSVQSSPSISGRILPELCCARR